MLEHHRERRQVADRQAALAQWQARHDAYVELIDTARTFTGTAADGILLAPGESVYLEIADTSLVEERRGPGTYVGRSQGFSVPVAKVGGRQIRYRVGASKGHFVQGAPTPTDIDSGTTWITSKRVVFQGARQTRECAFAKLVAVSHDGATGTSTFSVSNRAKAVTVHYGATCAATVDFRLELALAHFRGTVDELVAGLEADLAAIDADRPPAADTQPPVGPDARPVAGAVTAPPPPAAPAPSVGAGTTGSPSLPGAGWYADPWGAAPLRWWDGTTWSWQTVDPSTPTPR